MREQAQPLIASGPLNAQGLGRANQNRSTTGRSSVSEPSLLADPVISCRSALPDKLRTAVAHYDELRNRNRIASITGDELKRWRVSCIACRIGCQEPGAGVIEVLM